MKIKLNYFAPLLVAGAAAAAIVAAPAAAAASQQSCASSGSATQCQTPGNVQIHTSAPAQSAGSSDYLGSSSFGSTYGPFFTYSR
jgi:hypothetical protein